MARTLKNWELGTNDTPIHLREAFGHVTFNHPTLGENLWLFGGRDAVSIYNDVWRSPDGRNFIQHAASSLWPVKNHVGACVFNNEVWCYGGESYAGIHHAEQHSSSDLTTWVNRGVPAFGARSRMGVCVHEGVVWMFGGYNTQTSTYLNDILTAPDGYTWSTVSANVPGISARAGISIISFQGRLWVYGGEDNVNTYNDIHSTVDGITWTHHGNAAWGPRTQYRLAIFNGRLYLSGGTDRYGSGEYNDVWSTTDGITWEQEDSSFSGKRAAHGFQNFKNRLWIYMGGTFTSGFNSDTLSAKIYTPPAIKYVDLDLTDTANGSGVSQADPMSFRKMKETPQDSEDTFRLKGKRNDGARTVFGDSDKYENFPAFRNGNGIEITSSHKVTVKAPEVVADSPSVKLGQGALRKLVTEDLITIFNDHVHTGVTTGPGSSGPPAIPLANTICTSNTEAS